MRVATGEMGGRPRQTGLGRGVRTNGGSSSGSSRSKLRRGVVEEALGGNIGATAKGMPSTTAPGFDHTKDDRT